VIDLNKLDCKGGFSVTSGCSDYEVAGFRSVDERADTVEHLQATAKTCIVRKDGFEDVAQERSFTTPPEKPLQDTVVELVLELPRAAEGATDELVDSGLECC
jgi:hypothetical protein